MKRCLLCGCTEDAPCIGGRSSEELMIVPHRLVEDPDVLGEGERCHFAAELDSGWLCSAHTVAEVEGLARKLDPDEAMWGDR